MACLALIQANPRSERLDAHEYVSIKGIGGEPVWEAKVERGRNFSWRVFWHEGPGHGEVTILAILAHTYSSLRRWDEEIAQTRTGDSPDPSDPQEP